MRRLIEFGFSPVLFIGMEIDEIIKHLGENYNLPPEGEEVDEEQEYDLFLFGSRHLGNKLVYLDEPEDVKRSFSGLLGCLDMDESRFHGDLVVNPRNITIPKSNADRTELGIRITVMEWTKGSKKDVDLARAARMPGASILPFNCYVRKQDNLANYHSFKR